MTLSEELTWRGLVNQTTYNDLKTLDGDDQLVFYHGFDASSDSQTIGNLAAMMLDRCFLRHGHKAIIVAGGATSLIGDPGGKDNERELQSVETIDKNVIGAEEQIKRVFSGFEYTLVNNLDWTKDMTVIDYLRNYGKFFSMTPLIQRDYIASRIGENGTGISYAEFSYTVLQGVDFLQLYDSYKCTLQLGGSDQWGNCLSGVELIRRVRGVEVNVITLPLIINQATGKKFGKTEEGAIWLDPTKTSPTEFYQFWMTVDDRGLEGYLKVFTELSKEQIDETMKTQANAPGERHGQSVLASEVTTLVHGNEKTDTAKAVTEFLNGKRPIGEAGELLEDIRKEIPTVEATNNSPIAASLVSASLASSLTDARRLIEDSAVSINGHKVTNENFTSEDFQNGVLLLRRGKTFKDAALVEIKD